MRTLIDQHAVNGGAQISAMIEIESAQIKLVGLALAAVLTDDEPGHRFEQFARAIHGARFKLLLGDGADACGVGNTKRGLRTQDDNLVENLLATGAGVRRHKHAQGRANGAKAEKGETTHRL